MAELTAAKMQVVQTLRDAGIIQPHTGHDTVLLAALDEFAGFVAATVSGQIAAIAVSVNAESMGAKEQDRIEGSPRELVEQKFGDASEEIARLRYELAQTRQQNAELTDSFCRQIQPGSQEEPEPEPVAETQEQEPDQPVSQNEVVADGD